MIIILNSKIIKLGDLKNKRRIKKEIRKILNVSPYRKIKELLIQKPRKIDEENLENLPKKESAGVYLIYKKPYKKESFVYVGETHNIFKRLRNDLWRYNKHAFIKHLLKKEGIKKDKKQEILRKKYLFSYVHVEKGLSQFIEEIIMRVYRNQLWNKLRGDYFKNGI